MDPTVPHPPGLTSRRVGKAAELAAFNHRPKVRNGAHDHIPLRKNARSGRVPFFYTPIPRNGHSCL